MLNKKISSIIILSFFVLTLCNCKKVYNKIFKTKIYVTVTDGNTGLPVKDAEISISGISYEHDGTSNSQIFVFADFNGLTDGNGKLYYEFKAKLKSENKYNNNCTTFATFPKNSNYTKGMPANGSDYSDVKLGQVNNFNYKFY